MKYNTALFLFLAFIVFSPFSSNAQEISTNKPALTNRLNGFEKEVEQLRTRWNLPGLGVGIVTDSSVVWSKGFGVRNIKTREPVTDQTLFGIGSATKAFTAAGLGILKDKGKINWETPIKEYLPTFRMHDEFATEEMIAIDLLTHRSGVPRQNMLWYNTDYSRENLVQRLRHLKPTTSFRTEYQYSNLMYMTAGYLAGQVNGSSWEEFTRRQILEPLGMKRTTFSAAKMQEMENYATPYKGTPDTTKKARIYQFTAAGPAGAINTSVSDMNTWLQLFLNEGNHEGTQVIDTTTIAELTQPRIFTGYPPSFLEDYGAASFYGMGWTLGAYDGNRLLLHTGNIDGFLTIVGMLPDQEVGWVILTNKHSDPNPVHSIIMFELINIILDKDKPDWNKKITGLFDQAQKNQESETSKPEKSKDNQDKAAKKPSHPIKDYVGTYINPGYGTFEVTMNGDRLIAHFGTINSTLRHKHYDVFKFNYIMVGNKKAMNAQFKMDMDGNIEEVIIPMEQAEPIVFTRN